MRSLRLWLFLAMVSTAAVSLAGAYVLFGYLNDRSERVADTHKASQIASALAAQMALGASTAQIQAMQELLPNDQIRVIRDDQPYFVGPTPPNPVVEASTSARFPGGSVTVVDHKSPDAPNSLVPTLVAAVLLTLMIAVTMLVTSLLTRAIRIPIRRATAAADRLAAGDLSARVGSGGPDEFNRLARAFDLMAARIESADRDQHQFLADVAHEVATPVNTLSGFALSLVDGVSSTSAERAEAADVIRTESTRLHRLLHDLRRLSRLDLAEPTKLERVDHETVCKELSSRFSLPAERAGVTLRVYPAPGALMTDRRLLHMVLDNVVANAIQHTPAGGRVQVELRKSRHAVTFLVRDTGTGIAEEHQARVFDRLYRVEQARDRNSGGSGLGLALAQRAARSLHGRLEFRSALGVGSEFSIVLPSRLTSEGKPPANLTG